MCIYDDVDIYMCIYNSIVFQIPGYYPVCISILLPRDQKTYSGVNIFREKEYVGIRSKYIENKQ